MLAMQVHSTPSGSQHPNCARSRSLSPPFVLSPLMNFLLIILPLLPFRIDAAGTVYSAILSPRAVSTTASNMLFLIVRTATLTHQLSAMSTANRNAFLCQGGEPARYDFGLRLLVLMPSSK